MESKQLLFILGVIILVMGIWVLIPGLSLPGVTEPAWHTYTKILVGIYAIYIAKKE